MNYKILEYDEYLKPFAADIELRMSNYERKKNELLGDDLSLKDFANGHEYYGFHKTNDGWYYREWAPAAEKVPAPPSPNCTFEEVSSTLLFHNADTFFSRFSTLSPRSITIGR